MSGWRPTVTEQIAMRGTRGGALTIAGSAAAILIQVVSVVVLSRLLRPEDFGLVAMVGVFVALGGLLKDFGLPLAGLQAKNLSPQQASNLFWLNLALATATALVLALSTPLLVALYSEPRLTAIVPSLAGTILLSGVGSQIQVNLARAMRYPVLVSSDIGSQLFGLAAAITVALVGWGYWALVAQSLVTPFVLVVWRWVASGWVPTRFRRGHDSRRMFRVGVEYGIAQFLAFLQSNADSLIIGVKLGAAQLGLYNRGYQLLTGPANRVLGPLTQVVIPTINRMRAEGTPYEPVLLRVQFALGCLVVWLFSATGGTAEQFVPLLLGPGWEYTISVFRTLAIGGSIWVFSYVSYWAFILNEQSRELLHYNLVSKPLAVMCLIAGSYFGIDGVAWGYVVAMALSWPLNLAWLARTAKLPAWSFAANGVTVIGAGLLGGVAAWFATAATDSFAAVVSVGCGVLAATAAMAAFLIVVPFTRRQLTGATNLARMILGMGDVGSEGNGTSD